VRFRLEQFVPEPLDAVEAALLDPEFIKSMGALPNLGHPELVRQEKVGPVVRQQVRYAFAGELSSTVTRVVDPARLTWIEASSTDTRTHVTDFEIRPDHYAGRLTCRGQFRLHREGQATRRTAEGDLSVHIPFVGRRAESAIVSGLVEHARLEAEMLADWLSRG
jgi:hypothetical protein